MQSTKKWDILLTVSNSTTSACQFFQFSLRFKEYLKRRSTELVKFLFLSKMRCKVWIYGDISSQQAPKCKAQKKWDISHTVSNSTTLACQFFQFSLRFKEYGKRRSGELIKFLFLSKMRCKVWIYGDISSQQAPTPGKEVTFSDFCSVSRSIQRGDLLSLLNIFS